ncbi:hypothetical protein FA13DRAFT_1334093 [Coprinellus micaceus]|uniref:Uncharacterized protein n=1 Tax=Coprinellus micaceus TaxID=71717 RepID=A0A4Y7TMC2_COPMI|nr:hypothetical protein FA13DRAFT_1334093 [Coprinellus micaceus]
MTCLVLGSYPGLVRCRRMKSIILCSPSPGTEESEMMTCICVLQVRESLANKNITHIPPSRVLIHLLHNPKSQRRREQVHEGGARGDGVGIPGLLVLVLVSDFLAHRFPHANGLLPGLFLFLGFLCGAEATGPLLVHLCSGCHTICGTSECCECLRGAHTPMAMKSNFLGRTMFTTLSVYLKTSTIISSSVSGAGCSTSVSIHAPKTPGSAHLSFRMGTRMDLWSRQRLRDSIERHLTHDSVHVKIQGVKLYTVRVVGSHVDGDGNGLVIFVRHLNLVFLLHWINCTSHAVSTSPRQRWPRRTNLGVFLAEPTEQCRDTLSRVSCTLQSSERVRRLTIVCYSTKGATKKTKG